MPVAYLGLGSNLGDARAHVLHAIELLSEHPGITLVRSAALYGSTPYGPVEQQNFVNTVVEVETDLQPLDLLAQLKDMEQEIGRVGGKRWGPREIDLDILILDDLQLDHPDLQLPHPGMAERAFVLVPLAELIPEYRLSNGQTVLEVSSNMPAGLVWLLEKSG